MTTTKVPSARSDIQLQLADLDVADEATSLVDLEWEAMMYDEWILFGDDAV